MKERKKEPVQISNLSALQVLKPTWSKTAQSKRGNRKLACELLLFKHRPVAGKKGIKYEK